MFVYGNHHLSRLTCLPNFLRFLNFRMFSLLSTTLCFLRRFSLTYYDIHDSTMVTDNVSHLSHVIISLNHLCKVIVWTLNSNSQLLHLLLSQLGRG